MTKVTFRQLAKQLLKEQGYKLTPVRELLIELFEQSNKPLSAYEIKEIVKERNLNVVTVYRTIKTYEELGLIHHIKSQNGYAKCSLDPVDHHNHHSFLVCVSCHDVKEYLDQSGCQSHKHKDLANQDFHCLSHVRETLGHCHSCHSKA